MKSKILIGLAILSLTTIFCTTQTGVQVSPTANINGMVSATLTAMASTSAPVQIPSDTPSTAPVPVVQTGLIMGTLSYPAEALPAQRVVAKNTSNGNLYSVDTVAGQAEYSLEVPAGTYTVVAYVIGSGNTPSGLAAGYTQMVPCGLSASCTDHTLIQVNVSAGSKVLNINPQDWYAPTGTFPPMP